MESLATPQLKNQQKQFSLFINEFVEKFKPEQIYCFGINTTFNSKSNCFMKNKAATQCHYFLLVVTENPTRIEHQMQDYANSRFTDGTVNILSHGKEAIAEALASNNRFFNTVCSSAQIIYKRDGIFERELITPFIPAQESIKALKHFNHRMEMVDGFIISASKCLDEDQFNACVFLLHQTVEQICIALIRVHLAYRTDSHNLHRLLRLCSCFSDIPSKMLFQSGINNDIRLFNILVKSYSSARYNDNFDVAVNDVHALFNKVTDFVPIAKEMCKQKIIALNQQAEAYKQTRRESEVNHA